MFENNKNRFMFNLLQRCLGGALTLKGGVFYFY